MTRDTIIVCGSRDWNDEETIGVWLMQAARHAARIVHGGCRGADEIAGMFAGKLGLEVVVYPANWALGPLAGPTRNKHMVETERERARRGFAFSWHVPGASVVTRGTGDCVLLGWD